MLDAHGANTTAAAAVLAVARHMDVQGASTLVLAATGPVGQRVVRLLAHQGAVVRVGSRSRPRAEAVCARVRERYPAAQVSAHACNTDAETADALRGVSAVIAAGAAATQLLSRAVRQEARELRVAVDLNAVPPYGLEGIEVHDRAVQRDTALGYGAIGIGGTKMKIHKEAIARLFNAADQVFDAEQILAIGRELGA
jgi:hypothetical protein